jgi:DNA mismatch repair protein MutL
MIKVLPDELINQIAAGEVVERPASVVKELIENSLDAKAQHITIEIKGAGKKYIRVTDDGNGMTEEEIKLALTRHSTSKISSAEDLFNIQTLGFRGEALPSIASVSKMTISPNKSGKGLTAEVKDLFYNTPARLKFLKSDHTENSQIMDLVLRMILSHPEVAFSLTVDEKKIFSSPGNASLKDAILAVYGLEIARELMEVKTDGVSGFISKPNLSRVDRGYESFFVNGRLVKNFLLSRAAEDAYRALIPSNRYPIAILSLAVSPKEVDVNVHPTKREVKFLKTQVVMNSVYEAVKLALGDSFIGVDARIESRPSGSMLELNDQLPMTNLQLITNYQNPITNVDMIVSEVQPLIPIYQHLDTYIIATDGVDLVLIDQHAAHERVLFDRLNAKGTKIISQELLISETIELVPDKALILKENLNKFKELGFGIEEFGKDTYIIRAVPAVLKGSAQEVLQDIVDAMDTPHLSVGYDDALLKLVACHSAVKAGDKLTREEMDQLIRDLYRTQNPLTCPHGRPTMVKWRGEDLDKLFERT